MTIRVRQLAHVCLLVRDLAASEAFYRDALGLAVKFRFDREGRRIGFYLDAGGRTNVEVFERAEAAGEAASSGRIDHLCLEVEDIAGAVAHLRALGVSVTEPKLGVDATWQAWTADPDGVRIELFEYTRGSAQFVGGDRTADW